MRNLIIGLAVVVVLAGMKETQATEIILRGFAIQGTRPGREDIDPLRIGDQIELRYRLGPLVDNYQSGWCHDMTVENCNAFRVEVLDIAGRTFQAFGDPHGHFEYYLHRTAPPMTEYPYSARITMTNDVDRHGKLMDSFNFDLLNDAWLRADRYNSEGGVIARGDPSQALVTIDIRQSDNWIAGTSLIDIPTTQVWDWGSLRESGFEWNSPRDRTWVFSEFVVIHDTLSPGDANADGRFNQLDIVQVAQADRYLNGNRVSWAQGDWNADGVFDQHDLILAQQSTPYQAGAGAAAIASVPETSTFVLVQMGALSVGLGWWRRRGNACNTNADCTKHE